MASLSSAGYTFAEEVANGVVQSIGILLGIAGLTTPVAFAAVNGGALAVRHRAAAGGRGGLYALGVPFHPWRGLRYHNVLWRVFVLTGSVLHFFAVLLSALPGEPAR